MTARLVFPILSLVIAGYLLLEQINGEYRSETVHYTLGLALPVIVFAAIQTFRELKAARLQTIGDGAENDATDAPGIRWQLGATRRLVAFVVLTAGTVLILPHLGYLLSFTAFLAIGLPLMGIRKIVLCGALIAGSLLFVHFVFVEWLSSPLPKGVLGL